MVVLYESRSAIRRARKMARLGSYLRQALRALKVRVRQVERQIAAMRRSS